MVKIGTFKIKTSFNVSGRGIVAVGNFINGKALIGSSTTVEVDGKTAIVKIKGVETGNPDEDGILPFGLLLDFNDDSLQRIVERTRLKEQTVDIFAN